ncbi:hypothetical protein BGX21_003405 [Mortierella sp. AD011]|nr:hypothetical protein BGX20_001560 [Mortierella sp. AD010]KAF9376752.1 hypothetical protein BGX21_003405 [Mortierella sp. AD011]
MFGSFKKLFYASAALILLPIAAQAQDNCGGLVSNGTLGTFTVNYYSNFTVLTINGVNNNINSENYVLYCGTEAPQDFALATVGLSASTGVFRAPLLQVAADDTYTSTYIEISGHRDSINFLESPQNIVSPCLQQRYANQSLFAFNNSLTEWSLINAGFLSVMNTAQQKSVWIPSSVDVDPLQRAEYIIAVAMFYNDGVNGQSLYNQIKAAYTNLQNDMNQIPQANRNRIAWVYYDFTLSTWKLRNSAFTKGIIAAAGGISFPLTGEVPDYATLSSDDIKTILLNSQVVIDQTDFTGQPTSVKTIDAWRVRAGFESSSDLPVLQSKKVYTLDGTTNSNGVSDYNYRVAPRPDILLKDLIYVQYPSYNSTYSTVFLNTDFATGGDGRGVVLTASNCGTTKYDSGDIPVIVPQPSFTGNPTPPAALVGTGVYGGDGTNSGSSSRGSSKVSIVVPVVCVVVILGAAFAFVSFKWGKRAKEDRFIELEEEMNNEIPLH